MIKPTKKAAPRKAASTKKASTKNAATRKAATKKAIATKKAATKKAIAAKKAPVRKAGATRKPAAEKRARTPRKTAPVLAPVDDMDGGDEVAVVDEVAFVDEVELNGEVDVEGDVTEVHEVQDVDEVDEDGETSDSPTSVYAPVADETAADPEVEPAWSRPPPPSPTADVPADGKPRGKAKKLVLVLAILVILGALLAGGIYLLISGGDEDGVAYTSLEPGNCFNNPPENFKRVTTVPCTGSHDLEVIAVVTDPSPKDAPYPGTAALVQVASERCAPDFQIYVGIPVDQSQLRQVEIVPQESSWTDGSRRLVCTVRSPGGEPLSRPARGSNV
ncbi:MAG TPA: septum formation family protein [Acidimicrobiales bacterium]|nr:septum formation family protein [Acidimicrobiales bacterium]